MQVLLTDLSDVISALNTVHTKIQSHVNGTLPLFSGKSLMDEVIKKYDKEPEKDPPVIMRRIVPNKKKPSATTATTISDDSHDDDYTGETDARPKATPVKDGGVVKRKPGRPKKIPETPDIADIMKQLEELKKMAAAAKK